MSETGHPMTGSRIDVLIVDDHLLLSETVAAKLNGKENIAVDLASSEREALDRIGEHGRYSVVLLDYRIPGVEGLNAFRALRHANNGGVALFSGVAGSPIVERALAEGAAGFIPKTLSSQMLEHAIRFIAEGEVFVPSDLTLRLASGDDTAFGLKRREMQVLTFLSEGLQNKEIARQIETTEVIVKMDMKSICRKLGVRNRTQAVIKAQDYGLI